MKSNTHRSLGYYLIDTYMQEYPSFCRWVFSFGCIQPDKNPATYLKGSIRWQWLRGHNWDNAKLYITKSGDRLQRCKSLRLIDFYRLGKLIHYTADAFTYAHNKHCKLSLSSHRDYERELHGYMAAYLNDLSEDHGILLPSRSSVSDFIRKNHASYMCLLPCPETDTRYCVHMCAQVLQMLLQHKKAASV